MSSILPSFNIPGKVSVLLDAQYGSTGKGLIAAFIAKYSPSDIAVTNASPNAGHTAILDGKKYITFHLPMSGVLNPGTRMYINAGAIVNPGLLLKEILDNGVNPDFVSVHPNAAVVTEEDIEYESRMESGAHKIASTMKGVGRALARKVMREAKVAKDVPALSRFISMIDLNEAMNGPLKKSVMIEVPQGFSLSLNSQFYPHCTSRNINVSQALADAFIHPSFLGSTMLSVRTFPIRVGNVPDGYSGDCYPDQVETTWETLGVEPEITTVTKRVRRVFTFSDLQYAEAVSVNRPTHVFLNFCNYLRNFDRLMELLERMVAAEKAARGSNTDLRRYFGFGPTLSDIVSTVGGAEKMYERVKNG